MRYRYLDLRRAELTSNLKKRSDVAFLVRSTLHDQGWLIVYAWPGKGTDVIPGFTEVETPMLLNSTPEGAREYLVPTRVKQSSSDASPQPQFYALSQSPQQPKQLLIASGAVDRYFQLARCFRDEDGRKDRQPEFTQVDLEMAWVSWGKQIGEGLSTDADPWRIGGHEVRDVVESIIGKIWKKVENVELEDRFRVMTYAEAMAKYGSDKPDLRFGLEVRKISSTAPRCIPLHLSVQIQDITSQLPEPLRSALQARGEIIEALVVPPHPSHASFARAAEDVEYDKVVERLQLGPSASSAWLNQSRIAQDVLGPAQSTFDVSELNAALGLTEGGTIWLARRHQRAEVRLRVDDIVHSLTHCV